MEKTVKKGVPFTLEPGKPVCSPIGPLWWHNHGSKMRLKECDAVIGRIIIEGSAARVVISGSTDKSLGWVVDWEVVQYAPTEEKVNGRVFMTDTEMLTAFDLGDYTDPGSDWLIERYGGSAASQGIFIRYRKFLNIPCPGTGHDGDPNVSIELDEDIKRAVRIVVDSHKV